LNTGSVGFKYRGCPISRALLREMWEGNLRAPDKA
jgi:hypothetical protein